MGCGTIVNFQTAQKEEIFQISWWPFLNITRLSVCLLYHAVHFQLCLFSLFSEWIQLPTTTAFDGNSSSSSCGLAALTGQTLLLPCCWNRVWDSRERSQVRSKQQADSKLKQGGRPVESCERLKPAHAVTLLFLETAYIHQLMVRTNQSVATCQSY